MKIEIELTKNETEELLRKIAYQISSNLKNSYELRDSFNDVCEQVVKSFVSKNEPMLVDKIVKRASGKIAMKKLLKEETAKLLDE